MGLKNKTTTSNSASDVSTLAHQAALSAEQISALREHLKEIEARMAAIGALINPKQTKGRVISLTDLKNNWG